MSASSNLNWEAHRPNYPPCGPLCHDRCSQLSLQLSRPKRLPQERKSYGEPSPVPKRLAPDVARDKYHLKIGVQLEEVRRQLTSIHRRHCNIGHEQINHSRVRLECLQGCFAAACLDHLITKVCQRLPEHLQIRRFIINHERRFVVV